MLKLAPALVSALPEGFRLVPYLRRYSAEPIRLVGGVTLLARMLQAQFYDALPGTLMEGLGKLFASNVTFYVYPMPREAIVSAIGDAAGKVRVPAQSVKPLLNSDDLEVSPPMNHLYRYLREAGRIVLIDPP
jgi:hypothetical protein